MNYLFILLISILYTILFYGKVKGLSMLLFTLIFFFGNIAVFVQVNSDFAIIGNFQSLISCVVKTIKA